MEKKRLLGRIIIKDFEIGMKYMQADKQADKNTVTQRSDRWLLVPEDVEYLKTFLRTVFRGDSLEWS